MTPPQPFVRPLLTAHEPVSSAGTKVLSVLNWSEVCTIFVLGQSPSLQFVSAGLKSLYAHLHAFWPVSRIAPDCVAQFESSPHPNPEALPALS